MVGVGLQGAMGKVIKRINERPSFKSHERDKSAVPVPKHLNWLIWRLVVAKIATLKEINEYYDLCDVWDAHTALDLQDEAERRAMAD